MNKKSIHCTDDWSLGVFGKKRNSHASPSRQRKTHKTEKNRGLSFDSKKKKKKPKTISEAHVFYEMAEL